MKTTLKSLTALRHPLYAALESAWRTNERRYHAGVDAADDLTAFKWEADAALPAGEEAATRLLNAASGGAGASPAAGYRARKSRAVFPDFMREFAERLCGELFRHAPEAASKDRPAGALGTVSFGALGELGHDAAGAPTRAQMLWDNTDGVGAGARAWDAFWEEETAAATATGYRWIYVEAPPAKESPTQADEAKGYRPYLVGLSPLDVPYWRERAGRLDCAVLALPEATVSNEGGTITEETETVYHVLVRDGVKDFGKDFASGGWWIVNADGEVLTTEDGKERKGTWESTGGEIPLGRLWYERPARTGARGQGHAPAGLRAGTGALGAIAAEVMDLNSVAFHDTWTSAKRQRFVPVRDRETADYLAANASNPVVFVPMPEGGAFSIADSGEVSANAAVNTERDALTRQAYRFMTREIATSPDASGRAREIEHARGTSPRLASLAGNVEEAQNFALLMLELRWTKTTDGARATWTRRFDLESVAKALQPLVESMTASGVTSPTVWAEYVIAALKETGMDFATDEGKEQEAQIRAELRVGYDRERLLADADRDSLASDPDPEARARGIAEATEASGDSPAAPEA